MGVLKALAAEIFKMFAADLWLTIFAVAAVALGAFALRADLIGPGIFPFALAAAILAALAIGVARGARP